AIGLTECGSHAIDQRRWRVVAHEANGQLARDELRGRRMVREQLQHLHTFLLAVVFDLVSENGLRARLVHALIEIEISAAAWIANGPTSEAFRNFRNITLRVTAIDTERVQLHQLAAVVLVQPGFALCCLLLLLTADRWELAAVAAIVQ